VKRIAIIGGGYTGLVAARELALHTDWDITVLERGETLGGLAGGLTFQGGPLEKTYHHLFKTDTDILDLVRELGMEDEMEWWPSSMSLCRGGKRYPFSSALDLLRFKPMPFLDRLRFGAVAFYLGREKNWAKLESSRAAAWMLRWAGSAAMESVWGPLLRGKFSFHAEDVSMAWLWARVHIRANSRGQEGERLGYFRHGFAALTNKLQASLHGRVTVRTGVTVQRLLLHEGKSVTVQTAGSSETYDAVVFTGSSRSFAALLPEDPALASYQKQLLSIPYLGAACLIFATEQKIGDAYWTNINEDDAPFLVFLRHTRLVPSSRYNGREVYYLGAYVPMDSETFLQPEETLTTRWFAYLQKLFPDFDPSRVVEKKLFRLRDAQHVVDTTYRSRVPDYRTPLPGLYLANFSQIYPEDRGTNYAVREGKKIAHLLQQDLAETPQK
jgi:protoporphyrinogen oxidase